MHRALGILSFTALWFAGCEAPQEPVAATRVVAVPAPEAAPAPGHPPVARGRVTGFIEPLGVTVRRGPDGLLVIALDLDAPGALAGLRVGDVVAGVGGTPARDPAHLERLLGQAQGAPKLEVRREGALLEVSVKPAEAEQAAWTPFGLQVRDLPASAREALGLSNGVMVVKVRAPADRTRILPGDVIVAVGDDQVRDAEEFRRLAAGRHAPAVGLHVRRADAIFSSRSTIAGARL